MPILPKPRVHGVKTVVCTHCGHHSEAGKRAMSVFCPKCHKRIILEDLKIKSYYAVSRFATSGNVVVEKKGFVIAPIHADQVTVKGRVQGAIAARGWVRISKTGQLKGDITAPSILVEAGAAIDGFLRIGVDRPEGKPAEEKSAAPGGKPAKGKKTATS